MICNLVLDFLILKRNFPRYFRDFHGLEMGFPAFEIAFFSFQDRTNRGDRGNRENNAEINYGKHISNAGEEAIVKAKMSI